MRKPLVLIPFITYFLGLLYLSTSTLTPAGVIVSQPSTAIPLLVMFVVSFLPFSIYEYYLERRDMLIEKDIPVFLSTLEASILAKPFFQALADASKSVKHLGKYMKHVLKRTEMGEEFGRAIKKYLPGDTYMIEVFKEYLTILSIAGEELYDSIGRYRRVFLTLAKIKNTLRNYANSLTVLIVIIIFSMAFMGIITVSLVTNLKLNTAYMPVIETMFAYTLVTTALASAVSVGYISKTGKYGAFIKIVPATIISLIIMIYFYKITIIF